MTATAAADGTGTSQAGAQTSLSDSITEHEAKYTTAQLDALAVPLRAKLWFPASELFPDVFKPSACQNLGDLLSRIDIFKASRGPDTKSRTIKVILVELQNRDGRLTRLRILYHDVLGREAFEEFLEDVSALGSSDNNGDGRSVVDLILEYKDAAEPGFGHMQ